MKARRPRLGREYAKLWTASAVSNVGDGVTLAAGPLLLASLTDDPALIGGAVFAQQLPWLLFSLLSGVYVDRLDRRRLVVVVNLLRAAVLAGLALAVWSDEVNIPLIYAACFLLGIGETFADNASVTLLPSVVSSDNLARANAGLVAVRVVGNQLGAPPLGAYLFVVAAAVPFGLNAVTFVVAALFMATLRGVSVQKSAVDTGRRSLRADIAEGVRALWHSQVLRMLAICLCLMNITYMGAFSVLVLYVRERLGLAPVGFGLLLAATSVGALLGTLVVARLEERFGAAPLLRIGLVIETSTHLVLAVTRSPWVAAGTLVIFGVHAAAWGMLALSQRQRAAPDRLLGRVNSVYQLFSVGGAALGSLCGGLVARALGITAPFWIAFGAMVVLTAVAWRLFTPAALGAGRDVRAVAPEPVPSSR